MSLVDGYDRVDHEYIDDFLLLFRVFMTQDIKDREKKLPPGMIKLCLTLTNWLDQADYRDKVVKIMLEWLSSYYHDFELNPDFSYLFFKFLESKLVSLSMTNQLHLLHVTLSAKSKIRQVTISKSSREQPLSFSISGGYEKNCGIFVTHVFGSYFDSCPYYSLMNYLKHPSTTLDTLKGPPIPPRNRTNHPFLNQDTRISVPLRPGDQILEVNGTNFSAIKLVEAQKKLDMSTHLSLIVRYNPSAFNEMRTLPEGRRKSSLSSTSSVSPYQPSNARNRFTFNPQEYSGMRTSQDQPPPPSPLFSSTNFAFKSIIKDRSKFSSIINSSKHFVKQIRDSTMNSVTNNNNNNNLETQSKGSDSVSDDIDMGKAKSNSDIASLRGSERAMESVLSNVVPLEDLNLASVTDCSNGPNHNSVHVLRVFNAANNDSRYLLVHAETTAREVVMVAVREFNLTSNGGSQLPHEKSLSSLDWHLYEVSVVPESRTIKQKCLSEQTSRLAERASLCSRFYIKNNLQSSLNPSRLDMGDDALVNEILKENPRNTTLTSLNATLLAVELTLADFDKFKSIEPQQFVYDTFFDYSERSQVHSNGSNADGASLKSFNSDGHEVDSLSSLNKTRTIPKDWMNEYKDFADISNKEMFWVVCEILNERNLSRRVKIIKQFIRIADVCYQLRNYNSMFAIISGLGNSCVNRLKRTFDKLKPKYKNQLEKMRTLFDPSRNMSNYRICLQQTPPPAIPLFPQIKKDLTFSKEGRSIFVREPNDLSDDEDSVFGYPQDTIKRRTRAGIVNHPQPTVMDQNSLTTQFAVPPPRSTSHPTFDPNRNMVPRNDSILVNFAEIRQFTDRVKNVTHFSSIPYSNDLLTNSKDSQRSQPQIRRMHGEWQMRKRIRHYMNQTFDSVTDRREPLDQVDSSLTQQGPLRIIYDERVLYQRSLEVEPELNTNNMTRSSVSERQLPTQLTVQTQLLNMPPVTPIDMNLQVPYMSNRSPTLSKSSSLSSCSSFNHQLPGYHASRSNFVFAVGKFGTESTESLRKLRALSENVDS